MFSQDFKVFIIGFSFFPLWVFIFLKLHDIITKRKKSLDNVDTVASQNLTQFSESPPIADSTPITEPISTDPSNKNILSFQVAGVTKTNDKGVQIQKVIDEIVNDYLLDGSAYDFMTNKEILESCSCNQRVYKANLFNIDGISFIPEPTNTFDSNAIKIIIDDYGHIGYIPKSENTKVGQIISGKNYKVHWEVVGGPYKYIDEFEDKVRTRKDKYGIKVDILYD